MEESFKHSAVLSLLLVILSLLSFPPSVFSRLREDDVLLINGTAAWDRFLKYPFPVHSKIHFFNISGWEDFDGDVSALKYNEVGPYVYNQHLTRQPIYYAKEGDTNMTYILRREFQFNQELSGHRKESDQITISNPVLTTPFRNMIKNLTLTDSVDSISFNGTKKFIQFIRYSFLTGEGLEGDHYAAEEEDLSIWTGTKRSQDLMKIIGFLAGHNDVWPNPIHFPGTSGPCNEPRGTDGTQFHPDIHPEDSLEVYDPLMCRSFTYHRMENVEVRGIKSMRFTADEGNYDNRNMRNQCYCYPEDSQPCEDDTLPLKHCNRADGKDIVASTPYFRHNPELRKKVGLEAPKEINTMNYGNIIDVDPVSGMTLSSRKRFQWNLRLTRDPNHPLLKNLTEESVLIPLFWVEEAIDLDEKNAGLFR